MESRDFNANEGKFKFSYAGSGTMFSVVTESLVNFCPDVSAAKCSESHFCTFS